MAESPPLPALPLPPCQWYPTFGMEGDTVVLELELEWSILPNWSILHHWSILLHWSILSHWSRVHHWSILSHLSIVHHWSILSHWSILPNWSILHRLGGCMSWVIRVVPPGRSVKTSLNSWRKLLTSALWFADNFSQIVTSSIVSFEGPPLPRLNVGISWILSWRTWLSPSVSSPSLSQSSTAAIVATTSGLSTKSFYMFAWNVRVRPWTSRR
jgi:hypothetical protein